MRSSRAPPSPPPPSPAPPATKAAVIKLTLDAVLDDVTDEWKLGLRLAIARKFLVSVERVIIDDVTAGSVVVDVRIIDAVGQAANAPSAATVVELFETLARGPTQLELGPEYKVEALAAYPYPPSPSPPPPSPKAPSASPETEDTDTAAQDADTAALDPTILIVIIVVVVVVVVVVILVVVVICCCCLRKPAPPKGGSAIVRHDTAKGEPTLASGAKGQFV